MNRTFRKPLYKRLEPVNAWRGGRIANTDLLPLAEAANEASKHAGEEITAADFLRAASRGEVALHAIVHATAKVEKYDGGIYCNQGMPTENSIPKGAIPTLPLDACMQLANTGTASWRTFEGFDYDGDGDWCRFDIAWLEDGEPDFETVANDCRVTGYDVHALADAFLPSSELAVEPGTDAGSVQSELVLREAGTEARMQTHEDIAALATTRQIASAFPPPNQKTKNQWMKVLGDPPPWLIGARKHPGSKGKTALWNPVEVAIAMISEGHLTKAKAEQIIRNEFGSLKEEWDKSIEYL